MFVLHSQTLTTSAMGDLDVRLVLHGKNIKGRVQLKALGDGGKLFAADLQKCQGFVPANCPWTTAFHDISEPGVDLSEQGNQGYKVAMKLLRSGLGDGKKWMLQIDNKDPDSPTIVLGSNSVASLKVEKVVSDPLPVLSNPLGDHEAMLDYQKAQVTVALRMLYVQYNNSQLALYVQSKPYQALFALEEFKAQSIVLVPFSLQVSVNIYTASPPNNSVASGLLGHLHTDAEYKGFDFSEFTGKAVAATILPRMQLDSGEGKKAQFTVPFWAVKTCPDSKDANLVMKVYTANDIGIRCLVNDKKIKVGDELMVSEATKKELADLPMDTLKRKAEKDPNNAAKKKAASVLARFFFICKRAKLVECCESYFESK